MCWVFIAGFATTACPFVAVWLQERAMQHEAVSEAESILVRFPEAPIRDQAR